MTRTKHLVIGVFVLACLIGTSIGIFAAYQGQSNEEVTQATDSSRRVGEPGSQMLPQEEVKENPIADGKMKADMFMGRLEEVHTGCFADGECYVVVDGKHVTALMGWSQETVGSVVGVEGFGDLESYIGNDVEVYAGVDTDGSYTLYGSEGFYIKLLDHTVSEPGNEGIRIGEPYPGIPEEDPGIQDEAKPQVVKGGCMVGGCSSQLCGEAAAMSDMVTTCEYRAEYACYQVATCERQSNGQCGWTMTDELTQCLMHAEHMAGMEVS